MDPPSVTRGRWLCVYGPLAEIAVLLSNNSFFFFNLTSENLPKWKQMDGFRPHPSLSACTEAAGALPSIYLPTWSQPLPSSLHLMLQTGSRVGSAAPRPLAWIPSVLKHEDVLPLRMMWNTPSFVLSHVVFHCSNKTRFKVGIYVVVKCVFKLKLHNILCSGQTIHFVPFQLP